MISGFKMWRRESDCNMLGIYFSGTGNSKYAAEVFCDEYDKKSKIFSIEDANAIEAIRECGMIVFAYPVQYSTVPKILREFISNHKELWKDKKIFVIATMGFFSGDGAGALGRLLRKYGAEILGGLHLKMPDSIGDEKVLKRSLEKNVELMNKAEVKIRKSVRLIQEGKPPKEGMGIWYWMAGFFGQRLFFGHKTKNYSDRLRVDEHKCIGCGKCERLCPMKNIKVIHGTVIQNHRCTMCYRCINNCPKQAITLLGKKVAAQSTIEKYLRQ